MRKILPLLMVGILVLSGLGAVATSEVETEKRTLNFSNLKLNEETDRITLELNGADSVLMRKNHYMVPTHIEIFTYPFGTEIQSIDVTPINIVNKAISKELMVAPNPVIVGQVISQSTQMESNPVAVSNWYEYDVGTGIQDNERCVIVKVVIFPVQYNPSINIIQWAENVEIEIKYIEPEQPITFNEDYVFIVLTPSEYTDELASFITHKNNRGISTKLVTLDEIYGGTYFPVQGRDNQEKIKYFIKDAIENWGSSYVLLVGGSLKFPTRTTHIFANDEDDELFVSDLYYADIYNETGAFSSWDTNGNDVFGEYDWGTPPNNDDVDLYPDIYLGRLACINGGEVTTAVNKIKTYENNEAYTQAWFTNLVVAGGDSFPGDEDSIDEGEYVNEEVISIMDGFIPTKLYASNGALTGITPPGTQKVSNAINVGCGFLEFSGHGNPQVWATHPHEDLTWIPTTAGHYSNSPHVSGLTNGDELPIVVVGACSVSKYNVDNDCFNWMFIRNPNGGGIASLGASALGWAYIGKWVTYGLVEGIATNSFEAFKDKGAITFGEMWGEAINIYLKTHPSMESTDYKTVEEWQPFGDPTLAIGDESQAPNKPSTPFGPTQAKVGEEHTYTTSTTDPDGDQVYYLFDWGDGEFSGWVGPFNSGATGQASHIWDQQGTYEIKVKAKDTHGVQSVWSNTRDVIMPKGKTLYSTPLILRLLEKFPNAFPILRHLLGY